MDRIYLDHSATTPLREEVLDAMLPYLRGAFGNAGSIHAFGREARRAVDDARDQVAALVNADPRDIVFTSGGTESDNLAVRGAAAAHARKPARVVVSAVEHHAVLHAAESARALFGVETVVAAVNVDGVVQVDAVRAAIDERTALVSVMHANNETGAVQPVEQIAEICAAAGVVFHCDTVQSAGKLPIDVQKWPVSLLAISGHKLYGPKGVGACYIRKGVCVIPQSVGGGQERERRAGTENVAGIVGLGKACELAKKEMDDDARRIAALRDRLERGVIERIPDAVVNGPLDRRLPTISNIRFPGADGESLVLALDMVGIAVSSGAACTAGSLDPSHVLLAMGLSHEAAQSAIRFSLGRYTTAAEIDRLLELLPDAVARARAS